MPAKRHPAANDEPLTTLLLSHQVHAAHGANIDEMAEHAGFRAEAITLPADPAARLIATADTRG